MLRTAIETGSASAATAGSRASIGKTWDSGTRSFSCSPPSVWIPIRLKLSQTLPRPTRQG